ncbi:MAG: polysaccharide biosynthesis tyrosine autokinase [Algisphaera sp.]
MTANPLSTIPPIGPTTGMTPATAPSRFKPIDPVILLRRHFKILLSIAILSAALGGALWYFLLKEAPQYTSKAQILVENTRVTNGYSVVTQGGGNGEDITNMINNEVNFIMSEEVIREALGRPEIQNTTWYRSFKGNTSKAREAMQTDLMQASMIRGTTLLNLTMNAKVKKEASTLLEGVLATYLNMKQIQYQTANSGLRKVFIDARDRAEDEQINIQRARKRFVEENNLNSLQVAHSDEQRSYNTLLDQHLALQLQLDAARGSHNTLLASADAPDMTDEENFYINQMPQVSQRQEILRQLSEGRRQLLASGKGERHAQVVQLDHQRDAVQIELDMEVEKQLSEYRALQLQMASRSSEGLLGQIEALRPKVEQSQASLQDLNRKLSEYETLNDRLENAQVNVNQAREALNQQTLLNARPDSTRVKRQVSPTEAELTFPKLLVVVPGVTFLLTGLSGGLLVLREMLDQKIRSPQDLKLLPDANLLGLVPHAKEDAASGGSAERAVERAPTGLLAESYRQIRTALLSKMDRRGYKTLVCTSAQPASGTSTVVQNLGMSLAFNGRSVLIIDANFRRPGQHKLLNVSNDLGLVDVLKEQAELSDVIIDHPDTSLSVLPTGRSADAPPELLEGTIFRGTLSQLETQYDIILIDAPPALLTSDSQLLSKHVDAIAVIIKAGNDKRGMLGRVLGQLDGQRADVLGIILSGVQASVGGYFRKSYEDFYRYRESAASTSPAKTKADRKSRKRSKRDSLRDDDQASPPTLKNDDTLIHAGPNDDSAVDLLEDNNDIFDDISLEETKD